MSAGGYETIVETEHWIVDHFSGAGGAVSLCRDWEGLLRPLHLQPFGLELGHLFFKLVELGRVLVDPFLGFTDQQVVLLDLLGELFLFMATATGLTIVEVEASGEASGVGG